MTKRVFSREYNRLKKERVAKDPNKNFPAKYVPKTTFTDKDSNGLAKMVQAYAQYLNWVTGEKVATAWRVEVVGIFDASIGKRRTSNALRGQSDITFLLRKPGARFPRAIYIEIKSGKDTQKPSQQEFEIRVAEVGAIYLIVWTWEEFYAQINSQTVQDYIQ